jgi:hypothetical protein
MLTASVTNRNLIIYSDQTLTGFNSSLVYVLNNNSFVGYNFISSSSKQLSLNLNFSATQYDNLTLRVFQGGLTGPSYNPGVTSNITITNKTQYVDPSAPSLFEVISNQNYNFTSFLYSNYFASSNISGYPSASLFLKRNPPSGDITINEGFQGPMYLRRFAAMSSPIFSLPSSGSTAATYSAFAFNYMSYGGHNVKSCTVPMTSSVSFASSSTVALSIVQDYLNQPGTITLGISSIVDLSTGSQNITFNFVPSIYLQQGKYWFVFAPTNSSAIQFGVSNLFTLQLGYSTSYYSNELYYSSNGILYQATGYPGLSATITTDRGLVLPSQDIVYDQLNNAQNITVVYGDDNINSYTLLASYPTSHYINKTILDPIANTYAIEILATGGQNGYQVGSYNPAELFLTNLANQYTTSIFRYNLKTPIANGAFYIKSTGDYYANNSIGNVLVSATDLLGVSTIQISTNSNFSTSSTTTINISSNTQQYINNLQFNFGNLGSKYLTFLSNLNDSINYLFAILYQGSLAYVGFSISNVYLIQNNTVLILQTLTSSIITYATTGATAINYFDSLGNIYSVDNNAVIKTLSVSVPQPSFGVIPISAALVNSILYIGVAQLSDVSNVSNRQRIYSLTFTGTTPNLSHNSWSTNIPEPEITFIYNLPNFGLIIGAYSEQNANYIGKIYTYVNGTLTQIYSTYLRPDTIYFSQGYQRIYVGFSNPPLGVLSGTAILTSDLTNGLFSTFVDRGINVSGQIVKQISSTKLANKVLFITDIVTCLVDEILFTITQFAIPDYSITDQKGLYVTTQNNNLNIADYSSTTIQTSYNKIYFEPFTAGFTSSFTYKAYGQIVFDSLPGLATSFSTSFYLQYPSQNASIVSLIYDGKNISGNVISDIFYAQKPKDIYIQINGSNLTGMGTIALLNGFNTINPSNSGAIVGIQSFVAPKRINLFFRTGDPNYDLFVFSDGTIRQANIVDLSANLYTVYAKFIDINGVATPFGQYATDSIYSAKQQQTTGTLPTSGFIFELNSNASTLNKYIPQSGKNNLIYAGSKFARASGFYQSDPFYASDVTAWGIINVLCIVPGKNTINSSLGEYGVSVVLYVAAAASLSGLSSASYTQFSVSTINNGLDYNSGVTIGGDISALFGQWLQFKLVLTTASQNISPNVQSVVITYYGAGKSYFVTKTFDTSVQGNFAIPPTIKRGLLTANFVTNGGQIVFGYTTDPTNGDVKTYTQITPNQVFTLPTPSSKIKFGVILKSSSANACFLDDLALQLDLGQDSNSVKDVYFMPPQAAFIIQKYYLNGVAVTNAFQFVNKTLGFASAYNWSFGTSSIGILTYYPPANDVNAGPPANRFSPIVCFNNSGPFMIGLTATGFVQNGVYFNSEPFTTILTAY